MQDNEFLQHMQRYVAAIAITHTTLRNQGAQGVVRTARSFVVNLDLSILKNMLPSAYPDQLDVWTKALIRKLPKGAKNWGAARKAINVFMTQAFSNRFLSQAYGLAHLKHVLETPLDRYAAEALSAHAGHGNLPKWRGIKALTPETSAAYQAFATRLAARKNLPRAHSTSSSGVNNLRQTASLPPVFLPTEPAALPEPPDKTLSPCFVQAASTIILDLAESPCNISPKHVVYYLS